MDKETLRMQMLSGIITESEYKAKLSLVESNGYEEQAVADANVILKGEAYPNDVTTFDEALEELYMIYSSYKASPKSFFLQDKSTPKKIDAWFTKYDSLIVQIPEPKKSLNENFVGMGMVGNIFDREKTDYELAFEHFTKGEMVNEELEEETIKEESSRDDEKLYLAFIKAANFIKGGGSDTEAWEMMWDEYPYM